MLFFGNSFFGYIIWIIALICAVWVIVDVLKRQKGMDETHRIIWIVAAILLSILTAIVYYFVVKKK